MNERGAPLERSGVSVHIIEGDCLAMLRTLPDGAAQCCVTSPPYYGLRDYGVAGQIGLEETPAAYVARLVDVFREVRRVLRDDGTLWLNLGDSYASDPAKARAALTAKGKTPHAMQCRTAELPAKNRLMIPARVALALQADGWWLRDEIVWHKPRTTPHPVKDRTVSAHEMVYLLAKRERYFFDWEAIEEPSAYPGLVRKANKAFRDLEAADPNAARKRPGADRAITVRETRRARSVWSISPSPYRDAHFATMPPALAERCVLAGTRPNDTVLDPFGGAGTTGLVAKRLGRRAVLIELNPTYARLARKRIADDAPLVGEVVATAPAPAPVQETFL
jgi:DNA modification methylase